MTGVSIKGIRNYPSVASRWLSANPLSTSIQEGPLLGKYPTHAQYTVPVFADSVRQCKQSNMNIVLSHKIFRAKPSKFARKIGTSSTIMLSKVLREHAQFPQSTLIITEK